MRNLIVTAFVSADGVMEAPGGEAGYRNAGWTITDVPFDEAAYELKGREQEEAGALLVGPYHLLVFPLLLGAGKRLFSAADKDVTRPELVEQEAYGNGVMKVVYDVRH